MTHSPRTGFSSSHPRPRPRRRLAWLLGLLPALVQADIGVDPTFGDGGLASTPDDWASGSDWMGLPDGGVIAAEPAAISAGQMVTVRLRRLDREGRLLSSWGQAGTVELSLGPFTQDAFDFAYGSVLGVAADGRILVGVYVQVTPSSTQRGRGYGLRIAAMLRADGSLDTKFGRAGLLDLPDYDRLEHRAAMQPDGTIFTTVLDMLADAYPVFIRFDRYTLNGRRDDSFSYRGPDGYDNSGLVAGPLIRPDGRLWVVTTDAVYRLLPDGSVDPGFADRGKLGLEALLGPRLRPAGAVKFFRVGAAAVRGNGQLLIACKAELQPPASATWAWGLALLDSDGRPVPNFGVEGEGVSSFRAGDVSLDDGRLTPADADIRLYAAPGGEIFATLRNSATLSAGGSPQRWTSTALLRWDADGRLREGLERDSPGWFGLGSLSLAHLQSGSRPLLQFESRRLARLAAPAASTPGVLTAVSITAPVDEGAGVVTVPVMRTGGTRGAISVHYASTTSPPAPLGYSSSDAEPGRDYEPFEGRLEWADGEGGVKLIPVRLLDDADREGYETVAIALDSTTGGTRAAQPRILLQIGPSDLPTASAAAPGPTPAASGGGGGVTGLAPAASGGGGGTTGLATLAALLLWTLACRVARRRRVPRRAAQRVNGLRTVNCPSIR